MTEQSGRPPLRVAASPMLRTEPASPSPPSGSVPTGAIAHLPRVTTRVARCTYDLWPPEVQAEMRAIWEGNGE